MAESNISVTFTAEDRDFLKSLAKQQKEIQKLQDKLKNAGRAAKKAGKETSTSFSGTAASGISKATKALSGYAAGFLTITAAVGQANKALTDFDEINKKAANKQVQLSNATDALRQNMLGMSNAIQEDVLKQIQEISKESGVGAVTVTQAVSQGLSATSGNVKLALDTVALAAQIQRSDPSALITAVGAQLDLAKVTGSDDPLVNQGFLSTVGLKGRVTDPKLQAANLPRGLAGASQVGATAEEAGAILATITEFMPDPLGARGSTAIISFMEELNQFFEDFSAAKPSEEMKKLQKNIRIQERVRRQVAESATIMQKIEFLQTHPKFSQQFFGIGEGFEKAARASVRGLVSGKDTAISQRLRENIEAFEGGEEGFIQKTKDLITNLNTGPISELADQLRRDEAAQTAFDVNNLIGARTSRSRNKLEETLDRVAKVPVDKFLRVTAFDVQAIQEKQAPEVIAAEQLIAAAQLESNVQDILFLAQEARNLLDGVDNNSEKIQELSTALKGFEFLAEFLKTFNITLTPDAARQVNNQVREN